MTNKENSPFTPGSPVPVELFVGRTDNINEVRRFIKQTRSGRLEHIFLTGDRGIGKSSLASYLRYLAASQEEFIGIHTWNTEKDD
ncbi:MAG TPA: ATP-binding protein [Thermodesulfovibrionia bacterium]|nr:ATP-binding protein [Thermodesulfovibrionia bacterium]